MAKLTQTKAFKKLLEIGSERGYVTTDEVDRLFPAGSINKEKLGVLFLNIRISWVRKCKPFHPECQKH